jgi:hypothetical protein
VLRFLGSLKPEASALAVGLALVFVFSAWSGS